MTDWPEPYIHDNPLDTLRELPKLGAWHEQAACKDQAITGEPLWDGVQDEERITDPAVWRRIDEAFKVCNTCPVVNNCRQQWREDGKPSGVWGGMLVGAKGNPVMFANPSEGRSTLACSNGHPRTGPGRCLVCKRGNDQAYRHSKVAPLCRNGHPKMSRGSCVTCARERDARAADRKKAWRERQALRKQQELLAAELGRVQREAAAVLDRAEREAVRRAEREAMFARLEAEDQARVAAMPPSRLRTA